VIYITIAENSRVSLIGKT